jgi:hypothetical protein
MRRHEQSAELHSIFLPNWHTTAREKSSDLKSGNNDVIASRIEHCRRSFAQLPSPHFDTYQLCPQLRVLLFGEWISVR